MTDSLIVAMAEAAPLAVPVLLSILTVVTVLLLRSGTVDTSPGCPPDVPERAVDTDLAPSATVIAGIGQGDTGCREAALEAWSITDLCLTLRHSYDARETPPDRPDAGAWAVVCLRGALLDEIERRDPAGFSRWLATEPHPGSDPADHLTTSRHR